MVTLSCSYVLCCLVFFFSWDVTDSMCSESWKLLKMHTISTRADGIGTNLLDHALAISVCDKLQLLPAYPKWVHRAGSKSCFKNICGSIYHDVMKRWLVEMRAQSSSDSHHNQSRHAAMLTTCPPLPRTSSQKTIRGIMELKQDLVTAVRTRIRPHVLPLFDANTLQHRPSSPAVCVHYRLFDVEEKKNFISALTKSHDCDQLIREINNTRLPHIEWPLTKDKCTSRYQQSSYADESMLAISKAITAKYPNHQRHLVGCDSNSRLFPDASQELIRKAKAWGFDHVQCSENTTVSDLDIHYLSQCDVLVAGHSTFSVMAMAFSSPQATVFSPVWSGAVAGAGLFTKHDSSGVLPISDLLAGID
jgi:hypothetical protein